MRVFSEGGPDGVDSPGRQMARLVEEVTGKDKVRLVFRLDRFGRGGDHRPFVEAGLPAVRFTEPLEDYRHEHQTPRTENGVEYGDLPKFMDFDFVAETADAVAKTLAEMANAPAPPRKVTLGGAVTPNAEIFLEGNRDAERAGYEILWRETTEARWSVVKTVDANAAGQHASPAAPQALERGGRAPALPLSSTRRKSSLFGPLFGSRPTTTTSPRGASGRTGRGASPSRPSRPCAGRPVRLDGGAARDAAAGDDPVRAAR